MRFSAQARHLIMARAGYRCEYCRAPVVVTGYQFHIDHIIPLKIGGSHALGNLALACQPCNRAKYTKVMAIDPRTQRSVVLFNPRTQRWATHFRWGRDYTKIYGRTDVGRATVTALQMNQERQVKARRHWRQLKLIP